MLVLGDLIAAAFDEATTLTFNRQQASKLAAFAVARVLIENRSDELLRQLCASASDPKPAAAEASSDAGRT